MADAFNPLRYRPEWDIDHSYPAGFLSKGYRVLVQHVGNRKFIFPQTYNPKGPNLYVAEILKYWTIVGGYTVKTNIGDIDLPKDNYIHFVFVPLEIQIVPPES